MSTIRLYRKFYHVTTTGGVNNYTLFTPTSVSAECYISGTGGTNSTTLIQSGLTITEEEIGIFYTDLDPTKYSSDITYDLVWYIQYTPSAPANKKLITRFRIKPYNIASGLDYEISSTSVIEYEILGTYN
jgi:hypothetical protein